MAKHSKKKKHTPLMSNCKCTDDPLANHFVKYHIVSVSYTPGNYSINIIADCGQNPCPYGNAFIKFCPRMPCP
jgi:hypothetical protein